MRKGKAAALIVSMLLLFVAPNECEAGAQGLVSIHNPADDIYNDVIYIPPDMVPLSHSSEIFSIPMPIATGENAVRNDKAEIDASNTRDGYVMVRCLQNTGKALKVIIKEPDGTPYVYGLASDGQYEVFPVSGGNGFYRITVYENLYGNKYLAVLETAEYIQLVDEFSPFIRPNQYVNYDGNSNITRKAEELTRGSNDSVGKIAAIYDYVIKNIDYDQQLAATVKAGYIPDVDKVLEKGKGICLDYAALMTAMLRSQGIPTKLVVGYRGKDYHAWISTYSSEIGWLDSTIYFDGKKWKIIDPTFASGGNDDRALKNTNDGISYAAKYYY